jgi:DNA replication and repair protein RecF
MAILTLTPNHFRNLHADEITFHSHLNFIIGSNASGKTSLLEAIYYLSTGKSFRSRRIRNIVNRDVNAKEFILFGRLSSSYLQTPSIDTALLSLPHNTVGIKKTVLSNTDIKLNGELIKSASKLAVISPVILIDPNSFELLTGAPKIRRKFLDWGVFHVEHSFSSLSNEYNNCLKQRNTLLRTVKIDNLQLKVWDQKLSGLAEEIDTSRKSYTKLLRSNFKKIIPYFKIGDDLDIQYMKGWDKELTMQAALGNNKNKDMESKFTQYGPHRANLKVTIKGRLVEDVLSRGQQKLLVLALYLAQIQCLVDSANKRTVVLIDDISAELDYQNLQLIFDRLAILKTQVICTALDMTVVQKALPNNEVYKMFHVEHGKILAL